LSPTAEADELPRSKKKEPATEGNVVGSKSPGSNHRGHPVNTPENSAAAKSTRRQVKKPTPSKGEAKIKTAVHLGAEAFRRLGIACVMEGKTQSDLVEALILTCTRHYVVSVRGQSEDRPNLDGHGRESEATAA
jgi:hypothetical protein